METSVQLTLLFQKYVQVCLELKSTDCRALWLHTRQFIPVFSYALLGFRKCLYSCLFGIKNAHFLIVSFKDLLKLFPSKQQFRKFKSLFPFLIQATSDVTISRNGSLVSMFVSLFLFKLILIFTKCCT